MATEPAGPALDLRRAEAGDAEFLFQVYARTRTEELAVLDWTPAQQEEFLRMQFRAQDIHYRNYYPGCTFDLILLDGEPAGRLYLHRTPGMILLMDIALLPEWRGRGVGSRLLRDLQEEARGQGQSMCLQVESFNPAHRLYERFGFVVTDQSFPYDEMRWYPAGTVLPRPVAGG